jgi:hypothetical protein
MARSLQSRKAHKSLAPIRRYELRILAMCADGSEIDFSLADQIRSDPPFGRMQEGRRSEPADDRSHKAEQQADQQNRLIWINTNFQVKNSRRLDMQRARNSIKRIPKNPLGETSANSGAEQNVFSLKHFHSHEESGSCVDASR